jgi:uncharacterized protein YceK
MRTIRSFGFLAVVVLAAGSRLRAGEMYILDMHAGGQRLPNSCTSLLWDADTVFYNTGNAAATVSLLGMTNGASLLPGQAQQFTIPAGGATSMRRETGWSLEVIDPLWIYRLDVPASVVVDSEMLPSRITTLCPGPLGVLQSFGKTQLPVFRSLASAGLKQTIRGLTVGDLPAHINVGIYNAGANAATAIIDVYRACDGVQIDRRAVSIRADSVQQFTGFAVPSLSPCAQARNIGPSGLNGLAFVTVVADQPSLSFGSVVSTADVATSSVANVPISTIQVAPGVVP